MLVKRVIPIFLVIVAAVSLDALASPTLDQSHLGSDDLMETIYNNRQLAQTFTVGIAGTLDSVVLDLIYDQEAPTYDITVELRTTTGGLPDWPANSLASVQFNTSVLTTTFALYSVDFSSSSVPVSVGDQLAIVLISQDDSDHAASWHIAYNNPYSGGQFYDDLGTGTTWDTKDYDAYFQTYVEPSVIPAPAALHLVVIGFSYFVLQRRKFV
ncbi:MAG: hypothetical protein FVQ84_21835 [Planctomycetes bacterium]|nr:hypothetical protein [Planctomycetota bacterium]